MFQKFAYDHTATNRAKRLAARPAATPRRKKWAKQINLWALLDNDTLALVLSRCGEQACVRLSGLDRRTNGVAKRALKQLLQLSESQWQTFRAVVERRESVFISGAPGTGKSHLLRVIRERMSRDVVWTASTGAAAEKIEARTLHSAFCISIDDPLNAKLTAKTCRRLRPGLAKLRTLVIDEVSILKGWLLDYVLRVLENLTFHPGAVQFVLCGDPLQLGEVNGSLAKAPSRKQHPQGPSPFWTAELFERRTVRPYVLVENFRQGDCAQFTSILNRARIGKASLVDMQWLLANARQSQGHGPTDGSWEDRVRAAWVLNTSSATPRPICLFCHRQKVLQFNDRCMNAHVAQLGRTYHATKTNGNADHSLPSLALKVGGRVILTRNLREQPKLFNGSMGTVDRLEAHWVGVRFDNGIRWGVKRVAWSTRDDVLHLPLEVGYAATIHKAQGATLESACVDLTGAFNPGHAYVALSRVRKVGDMEILGLDLRKLNHVNWEALRFYNRVKEASEAHIQALSEGEETRGK